MNYYKQKQITMDLTKPLRMIPVDGVAGNGDSLADEFSVAVTRNGTAVALTGAAVKGYFIAPDGTTQKLSGTCSGNVAVVRLTSACYQYGGAYSLAVKIRQDNAESTVAIFHGTMTETITDHVAEGNTVVYDTNAILSLIDEMEAAKTTANSAKTAANTAAQNANTAASGANAWANATVAASALAAGSAPTVAITTQSGAKKLTFGIPKGDQGAPYTIKGAAYATLAALTAGVQSPAVGDQYNVGSAPPYTVYRWTGSTWESQGAISASPIDATLTKAGEAADAKATGDALNTRFPKTGGAITGSVNVGNGENYTHVRVSRSVSSVENMATVYVATDGSARLVKGTGGTDKNYLALGENETTLGKPLSVSGGGTGTTTIAGAKAALGINAEKINNRVTFAVQSNFSNFVSMGGMVLANFQSLNDTFQAQTLLFTIAEGYRPAEQNTTIPFVVGGTAYGRALISKSTGECRIMQISTNATGVLSMNFCYQMG